MDVVQKVQNVLKSALDKPPTLTGSIPKIPEHANVEWSNILPSILSGETDTISPSSESAHHKHTMEKLESGSGVVSPTESSSDIGGTSATTLRNPTRKPDIQTNAYAGFTNNMQHVVEKPQHGHHSQPMTGGISEKPMIPVPVITLMEQKLSTLRPTVTESPVFEMLSVIPVVEATESAHKKDQITESSAIDNAAVRVPPETEEGPKQDEQFVELTLSEVPESTTASQISTVEQTNPGNKTGQVSGTSSESSTVVTETVTSCNRPNKVTSVADKTTSISNATYILIPSKNNTSSSEGLSSMADVTKESQVNGTRNDDEVIPENDAATSTPLSHVSLGSMEATEIASSSALTSASRIEVTTGSTLPHADRLGEDSSITKDSLSSVTVTGNHVNSQSIGSLVPMEPLPTQLIDSLSSVMSQVSEVKPPVLSLSSTSDGAPQIPIMNINYDERHNNMSDSDRIGTNVNTDSQQDQLVTSHDENITERIVSSETYATNATVIPSQDIATRIVDSPTPATTQRSTMAATNITNITGIGNLISANSQLTMTTSATSASTATAEAMINRMDGNATTPAGLSAASPDTMISESTTRSSVTAQLEKTENASSKKDHIETPAILEVAADAASEKRVTDRIIPAKVPVTTSATKPQPTGTESSTESTNGYLENTLTNLNWSNPMSAVDQVLNVASLPSNAPSIEPIALPNDTSKLTASVLASSLIAGFTTSTSEKSLLEDISDNQIIKIAPTQSARPTILSNVTKLPGLISGSVTQMYEKKCRIYYK